ncbi:MAG TPA: VWA domain-containing protein [Pyrinomonadaceae bacterium]|nr:VWA domain-containing protein [Pyrinomonadaceae bacterium]
MRLKLILLLLLLSPVCASAQTGTPAPVQETNPQPSTSAPLSYGLVVDNSGSLRSILDTVIDAAKVFVEGSGDDDEGFVIRFVSSHQITLLRDFTSNKRALYYALDEMYVEGGQTAIIDALYTAAEHLSKGAGGSGERAGRVRALVLLTDGEDRASQHKEAKLFELLREQKIKVFVLGFPEMVRKNGGSKKDFERATAFLNQLAKETGGHTIIVRDMSQLRAGAGELLRHMR